MKKILSVSLIAFVLAVFGLLNFADREKNTKVMVFDSELQEALDLMENLQSLSLSAEDNSAVAPTELVGLGEKVLKIKETFSHNDDRIKVLELDQQYFEQQFLIELRRVFPGEIPLDQAIEALKKPSAFIADFKSYTETIPKLIGSALNTTADLPGPNDKIWEYAFEVTKDVREIRARMRGNDWLANYESKLCKTTDPLLNPYQSGSVEMISFDRDTKGRVIYLVHEVQNDMCMIPDEGEADVVEQIICRNNQLANETKLSECSHGCSHGACNEPPEPAVSLSHFDLYATDLPNFGPCPDAIGVKCEPTVSLELIVVARNSDETIDEDYDGKGLIVVTGDEDAIFPKQVDLRLNKGIGKFPVVIDKLSNISLSFKDVENHVYGNQEAGKLEIWKNETGCQDVWEPVCADFIAKGARYSIKKTFGNTCEAQKAKAVNIRTGACPFDSNNTCSEVWDPVCAVPSPPACSGFPCGNKSYAVTYPNRCEYEKDKSLYIQVKDGACEAGSHVSCPSTWKPVCGELETTCVQAPCDPVKQTFENFCMAKKRNAQNIMEGECGDTKKVPANPKTISHFDLYHEKLYGPCPLAVGYPCQPGFNIIVIARNADGTINKDYNGKGVLTSTGHTQRNVDLDLHQGTKGIKKIHFSDSSTSDLTITLNDYQNQIFGSWKRESETGCNTTYQPVCAAYYHPSSPNVLKTTFGNECEAEKAKAAVLNKGECKPDPVPYFELFFEDRVHQPCAGSFGVDCDNHTYKFNVVVVARDAYGNIDEGYNGEGYFELEGDTQGTYPQERNLKLVNGIGTFPFDLNVLRQVYLTFTNKETGSFGRQRFYGMETWIDCSYEQKPVCGQYNHNISGQPTLAQYNNRCKAEKAGATNILDHGCIYSCPTDWEPVCGEKNNTIKTYRNACSMGKHGAQFKSVGECDAWEPVCAFHKDQQGCPSGGFPTGDCPPISVKTFANYSEYKKEEESFGGYSVGACNCDGKRFSCIQETTICPENYEPVCAKTKSEEWKTFSNACKAEASGATINFHDQCDAGRFIEGESRSHREYKGYNQRGNQTSMTCCDRDANNKLRCYPASCKNPEKEYVDWKESCTEAGFELVGGNCNCGTRLCTGRIAPEHESLSQSEKFQIVHAILDRYDNGESAESIIKSMTTTEMEVFASALDGTLFTEQIALNFSISSLLSSGINSGSPQDRLDNGGYDDLKDDFGNNYCKSAYRNGGGDDDGDGVCNDVDKCPDDPNKSTPGACGCGNSDDMDSDGDGTPDCNDDCPSDPTDTCNDDPCQDDSDNDGTPDCYDGCPNDNSKDQAGECGCGNSDEDYDQDGIADCNDDDVDFCSQNGGDADLNGICDDFENEDSDGDGTPDKYDDCPSDPNKWIWDGCPCGTTAYMGSDGNLNCGDSGFEGQER